MREIITIDSALSTNAAVLPFILYSVSKMPTSACRILAGGYHLQLHLLFSFIFKNYADNLISDIE